MKTFQKGETSTASVKFPGSVAFSSPPTWTLTDWDDDALLSGAAALNGDGSWSATFTIPKTLVVPDGEGDLSLSFSGVDQTGVRHTRSKTIPVFDGFDNWQEFGVLYDTRRDSIRRTVYSERALSRVTFTIREGYGVDPTVVQSVTFDNPIYKSLTSAGLAYDFKIPMPTGKAKIRDFSGNGHYPWQLFADAWSSGTPDDEPDSTMTPMYVLNPAVANMVVSMRRYLDKARLDDIDKSLQWVDEELAHFLLEGVSYINAILTPTFWTIGSLPSSLTSFAVYAGCWTALNARFLAEGMNSFEFQGANTQLTFNRRDAIQAKMDDIKNTLDSSLPQIKKATITRYGLGLPPPGVGAPRGTTIGVLGVNLGPNVNRARFGQSPYNVGFDPYFRFNT